MRFSTIIVPRQVLYVINKIKSKKYKAYLVGGAVRDSLLGKCPQDYDIATNAPLEVLQSMFDCKVVGEAFGVVLVNVDDIDIQIAKFRSDGEYKDYRHPESVCYTNNIMKDLKRRDFTINTFAWTPGKLKYVRGAMRDLKKGIIRAVGNPDDRFNEDPLRMLRAVRFVTQFDMVNMTIEKKTFKAIQKNAHLIKNISAERIRDELNKILLSDPKGINLLRETWLLNYILPELSKCYGIEQNKWHNADVYRHTLEVIRYTPQNLTLLLTALLHDIGKPQCKSIDENGNVHFYGHEELSAEMAQNILSRLRYDNRTIEEVCYLIRHHMDFLDLPKSKSKIRKLLNKHGESRLMNLLFIRKADMIGAGRNVVEVSEIMNDFIAKVREVVNEKPPVKFEDLAINGNDIMEVLGVQQGKIVGDIKKLLMERVLENPEMNTREQLIEFLREKW